MNDSKFSRFFVSGIAVVLTMAYFAYYMRPHRDRADDFHYRDFGRFPVIDGGRYKPLDTVARTNLMLITHRQTYYDADKDVRYPATKWWLDVLTTPPPNDEILNELFRNGAESKAAWKYKIFRIENDQVLQLLDLKMRSGLRYSVNEIAPKIDKLVAEAQRIRGLDPKQKLNLFDAKVMELWRNLNLFIQLSGHATPLVIPNPDGSDQWKSFRGALDELTENQGKFGDDVDARTFGVYVKLLRHYDQKEISEFNVLLTEHLAHLESTAPALMKSINLEIFFSEFEQFYRSMWMYIAIALAGCLSWLTLTWGPTINRAAFASMIVVFLVHIAGLIIRMDLQNRWFVFVTNLYSSAVFIGLGCVFVCLIAEYIFRTGIALVVGSVTGAATLYIAHMLSLSGDTLEMMQAVLDTNFWLATHVTCITLGYTAAFVAGFMGIAYIVLGIFTPMLRRDGSANLTRMTYGVLCFGMLFSFVGTVLGGIWADQSWGRFWGWDPKENGALLIVIWIALILHARWGGMVKHRGIAVLAVLGNIVTSWSWFGTNFLGVGLHSYGFQEGAMLSLAIVDGAFLTIALVGAFLPLHLWRSFQAPSKQASSLKQSPESRPSLGYGH